MRLVVRAAGLWYRIALRRYPRRLRRRYGRDMLALFETMVRERAAARGVRGVAEVCWRCAVDLLRPLGDLAGRPFGSARRGEHDNRKTRSGVGGRMMMDDLWNDGRVAVRRLARSPAFTAVSAATLALGLGATTAIFSVVKGVLLDPLPYRDTDRLVALSHAAPGWGMDRVLLSGAMYFTYRDEARTLQAVAAWDPGEAAVTGPNEPEQLPVARVTTDLFPLLGAEPSLGSGFSEMHDAPGAPPTVMLSRAYWESRFGSDSTAVGGTLRVDGEPHEVVGVLPAGFFLPGHDDVALYLPFRWDPANPPRAFNYEGVARMAQGATVDQVNADIDRLIPLAAERFPGGVPAGVLADAGFRADARSLRADVLGETAPALWILMGTVVMVLLIACANVANLYLVRVEGRSREVAVQTAIGASRGRIVRQLVMESLLLGLVGGLLGCGLAIAGLRLLLALRPASLPRIDEIGLDPGVLVFSTGTALMAGLGVGLYPSVRVATAGVARSLREGARGTVGGGHRLRTALAAAQVAMALVIVVGSGLMVRSFLTLRNVPPGFSDPEQVITFQIALPVSDVADPEAVPIVSRDLWDRLADIPGVESVGASSALATEGGSRNSIWVEDTPLPAGEAPPQRLVRWVSGGYFDAVRNPVVAGRPIDWSDIEARAPVAVVTRNFAEEHWGSAAAAVGRRIATGNPAGLTTWREVVGVVGDVRAEGLSQPAPPVVFWPLAVASVYRPGDLFVQRSLTFAVRTSRPSPTSLVPEIRAAVRAIDADVPVANIRTLADIRDEAMADTSFALTMLLIAAGVALSLGVVGIHGIVSYVVSQRTREIGMRIALGAEGRDVTGMVLRYGIAVALIGTATGLGAALVLTRFMRSLLFGVEPGDPATFATVAALLGVVTLVATYVPAHRAARLDPMDALRLE